MKQIRVTKITPIYKCSGCSDEKVIQLEHPLVQNPQLLALPLIGSETQLVCTLCGTVVTTRKHTVVAYLMETE